MGADYHWDCDPEYDISNELVSGEVGFIYELMRPMVRIEKGTDVSIFLVCFFQSVALHAHNSALSSRSVFFGSMVLILGLSGRFLPTVILRLTL